MTGQTENITGEVKRLSNRFRRRIFSEAEGEMRFSHSEGRIIHFILENMDGVYLKDIQNKFGMRASSASSHIKKLEESGLVKRESVEGDRRLKKIIPTEKLISQKDYIDQRFTELNDLLVKDISREDLDTFFSVIDKMIENMEVDNG